MSVQEQPKIVTSEEFYAFVNRPENRDRMFERVQGEIIEVSPANSYSSAVAILISYFFVDFNLKHDLGFVLGADAGFDFPDETTYSPDVAFISKTRQAELPSKGFNPVVPDVVVEVVSPGNTANEIHGKVVDYLAAGVKIVWIVYPLAKQVVVHTTSGAKTYGVNDTLDAGDVLPGFTLEVRRIFP